MVKVNTFCLFLFFYNFSGSLGNKTVEELRTIPPIFHLDNYDDCMSLGDKALYCTFSYTFAPSPDNQLWEKIQQLSSGIYNYQHGILRHGICVPLSCPLARVNGTDMSLLQDIQMCYDEKFSYTGLRGTVSELICETNQQKYPLDNADIVMALLLSALIGLVLFATIMDCITENKNSYSTLRAFSLPRNWNTLRNIRESPDIERLRGIQGIRFLNTVLVILTHTMMLTFMLPISNVNITETLTERETTFFLTSGPSCISTFFMMSSWLFLHRIMDFYKDKEAISLKELCSIFIQRYIRLTPTLALVVAFTSTWLRHMGDGPIWNHYVGREYLHCRENGWTNILYINNLVDPSNMCLQTTWYMALELQYFIINLLIIAVTKKYPKTFWWILSILLPASIIATFLDNYKSGFPAILLPKAESLYDVNHTLKNQQFLLQYISFTGNLGGPLIGLGIGHVYHKYKERKLKIHSVLWWFVSHMFTFGIILVPGILALKYGNDHSRFWSSLHIALSRPLFAFGVGFALLGMSHGVGGFVKSLLEWPPLYILGRLTYSAYLVHLPLMLLKVGSIRSPVYLNDYKLRFDFIGNVAMTYIVATLVTLCFEMPMGEILKRMFSKAFHDTTEKNDKNK